MTTRAEAIEAAAECLAQGILLRDSVSVEEAARLAWHPTGPPLEELEARLRAQRGLPPMAATPAADSPAQHRTRKSA